jgi:hypothetical protein
MTRIVIGTDGTTRGLWTDVIDWHAIGHLNVERASHIEFCSRRQMWQVRLGRPRSTLRRLLQVLLRRPSGEILHWARSREAAMVWEREYFDVGGRGWRQLGVNFAEKRPVARSERF